MNWTRSILDGLAMAAYFNLFAAAAALYKPRLMFPCYPSAIIKAAKEPPTKREAAGYWRWIILWEWLPLLLYGALSAVAGGTHGFWRLALTGYIQWMMVNLGDLFFLDVWLNQKKTKNRFVISGTEGHPGYEFKAWMKDCLLYTSGPDPLTHRRVQRCGAVHGPGIMPGSLLPKSQFRFLHGAMPLLRLVSANHKILQPAKDCKSPRGANVLRETSR